MSKILIVGAGISGSVLANLIATNLNKSVLVVDRKSHIAGNCYDYKDENNITVHKYGAHLFHTNNKEVWDYLSQFTRWHYFYNRVNAVIEGNKVSIPFSLRTLRELFSSSMALKLEEKLISKYGYGNKISILEFLNSDDSDLKFLGNYVYENVFKNYTIKQWGLKPEEIDPSVTARVPIYISNDTRYFQDKYQAIPLEGYTNMIKNILTHPNIKVSLNTDISDIDIYDYNKVFYSGAIDEYYNYKFGELPYRSLEFDIRTVDKEYFQETVVTNYPNDYDFTRIIEHKYFLDEKSDKTTISIEYPKAFEIGKNDRYYPISNDDTKVLYNKYIGLSDNKKITFFGRLGAYKYYNMDQAVEEVFKLFKNIKENGVL